MRTLTALYLLTGAAADHGTWDHPQQAELPSHEWLVVDHAPGTSFGLGVCVAGNAVFTAGSMAYGITLTNPATGASSRAHAPAIATASTRLCRGSAPTRIPPGDDETLASSAATT